MKEDITDIAQAINFVKNTLGCSCPGEVFKHVKVCSGVQPAADITLERWINVGGRLLVYILIADRPGFSGDILLKLINAGMAERDSHGFNRLRLVLASEDAGKCLSIAHGALHPSTDLKDLTAHVGLDDKVHVHVISRNSLF